MLVVPATANLIAKMATGLADDAATTTILATTAPKYVVPAMNSHMFANPATTRNLGQLVSDGMTVLDPATGMLAEGYVGHGRLPEPPEIVAWLTSQLLAHETGLPLHGQRVLVTAGGTREMLDPVRYISNRSSGKMGYAIARVAREMGAKVTLISAQTALPRPEGITYIQVTTAAEMLSEVEQAFPTTDMLIMAAAVSDYRPAEMAAQKIKKQPNDHGLTLQLTETTDILKKLAGQKQAQFVIGFAAETQQLLSNATHKLTAKNLDLLVANDVSAPGVGFNGDTNQVTLLSQHHAAVTTELLSKEAIAQIVLETAIAQGAVGKA